MIDACVYRILKTETPPQTCSYRTTLRGVVRQFLNFADGYVDSQLCKWRTIRGRIVYDNFSRPSIFVMDFVGQKLADMLSNVLLWMGAIVAFVVGFGLQNFEAMIATFGAAVAVVMLVVVPDWPFYNKHPIQWCTSSRVDGVESDSKYLNEHGQKRQN